MNLKLAGNMYLFGDNIDTDQIYPGFYLELTSPAEIAVHCMEGADSDFATHFHPGGVVVAGINFGCGSSREHAAITLKAAGVAAVIAKSFARIFYRNGINLGLPLVVCPAIDEIAGAGECIEIDLARGVAENCSTGKVAAIETISGYAMKILAAGGIKPLMMEEDGE